MPGHETTERARLRNGGARVLASGAENLPTASSPLSFFHSFQFLGWAEAGRKATPGVLTEVQFGVSALRRDRLSLMFQGSCSLGAPTHLSPVPPKPLVGKLSLRAPWSPQEPDTGSAHQRGTGLYSGALRLWGAGSPCPLRHILGPPDFGVTPPKA